MSLNVLVVDDSTVMRAMVIKALRESGLAVGEVYQAADGAEALGVLRRFGVDLALVDMNMPVMGGEEMIDRVRGDPATAGLPVVVISTEGSETRLERLRGKVEGFVRKPFTPTVLRETISTALGSRRRDKAVTALDEAARTALQAFGRTPTAAAQGTPRDGHVAAVASVAFRGPFQGRLVVGVSKELLRSLSGAMLGEAAPTLIQQQDALGELANVICGHVLPGIAGDEAVFELGPPQVFAGTGASASGAESLVAEAEVPLQQGRAELRLFVEGDATLVLKEQPL